MNAADVIGALAPSPWLLAPAVIVDLVLGDPVYRAHPVRLIGRALAGLEARLRRSGLDGYGGGVVLFVALTVLSLITLSLAALIGTLAGPTVIAVTHVLIVYSLLALGDLVRHVWRIEAAVRAGDLMRAGKAVRLLAGRDTEGMDAAACRRAGVESLSENLTDGFVSPVVWYAIGGLPGLLLFKVVSTMDSMVGYKTARYLKFGWCGARLDDAMNFVPARLTWLVLVGVASMWPGCSARKAWLVGLRQHHLLPGPNSGWSEAAMAGAVQRRLVGPIWLNGVRVTDVWIGDPADPPLGSAADVTRAMGVAVATGIAVSLAATALLSLT